MTTIKTATAIVALCVGLMLTPGLARADETSSAKKVGREYFNNEVNPFNDSSEDRGEPVIRGNGDVMMPGEEAPRQLGQKSRKKRNQEQEEAVQEEPKVRYVYDKAAHGLFNDDVLPHRLFNNVDPNR